MIISIPINGIKLIPDAKPLIISTFSNPVSRACGAIALLSN